MNARQSSGVRNIATPYEQRSATATVNGSARMNSPTVPGSSSPSGRKLATMVSVAPSTGAARSLAERQAASARGTPSSSSST
jgi:hypothetical protein